MDLYEKYYRELGIKPGDSHQKIRKVYRDLVRVWHPDRYGQDESARRAAEERTKAVNQAFQEIEAFFQQHGRLPLEPPPTPVDRDLGGFAKTTPPPLARTHAERYEARPPARAPIRSRVLAILVLGVSGYLALESQENEPAEPAPPALGSLHPGGMNAPESRLNIDSGTTAPGGFSIGSTLGDVFALQGKPTRIEDDIWHFGAARVFFKEGKVVRWEDANPPLLRTSGEPVSALGGATHIRNHFERGANKATVRAIQGAPLRETGTTWDYGLSRVFFDSTGHVSGWDESPLDPLRIKR